MQPLVGSGEKLQTLAVARSDHQYFNDDNECNLCPDDTAAYNVAFVLAIAIAATIVFLVITQSDDVTTGSSGCRTFAAPIFVLK